MKLFQVQIKIDCVYGACYDDSGREVSSNDEDNDVDDNDEMSESDKGLLDACIDTGYSKSYCMQILF